MPSASAVDQLEKTALHWHRIRLLSFRRQVFPRTISQRVLGHLMKNGRIFFLMDVFLNGFPQRGQN
jgi:hypothetical protein